MNNDATFDSAQCLFCSELQPNLEANLAHMRKFHGLFIPARDRLLVDVETLLDYFHLVIFGYGECLLCSTQRASPDAAQQHMMSKGHCSFDIEDEDSEYRDFYDFGSVPSSTSSVEDEIHRDISSTQIAAAETVTQFRSSVPVQTGDSTLRLPSGKTLVHRTAHRSRPAARSRAESQTSPESAGLHSQSHSQAGEPDRSTSSSPSAAADSTTNTTLTKSALRDAAFRENQLSRLRAADRRSLLHLPTSEQRALLAVQKKQLDKARRAEWAMRGRVEGMGNKTLMKTFVNDVPGRSNG